MPARLDSVIKAFVIKVDHNALNKGQIEFIHEHASNIFVIEKSIQLK